MTVSESVSELETEWMCVWSVRMNDRVNESVSELVTEWMSVCVCVCVEWANKCQSDW